MKTKVSGSAPQRRAYVCAHCSGRDWYQLPVALEQAGLLDLFCTDYYSKKIFEGWLSSSKALGRRADSDSFPDQKIKISWATIAMQRICSVLIRDNELRAKIPDDILMNMLQRTAAARDANIITYEPWAVRRPAGGFSNGRRQVIFHCHPHVDTEDRIYAADRAAFGQFYDDSHVTKSRWRRRTADAWRQADLVICASSFTKKSLLAAGLPADKCVVVPYGTGRPSAATSNTSVAASKASSTNALGLLFVGRNPLRKGLHHLLLAWKAARRNPNDALTIVCREEPPQLTDLAAEAGVKWYRSVSEEDLANLYREADALVVPSLCEGFGHVYLEAMSFGCPVVGTEHSVLADLPGAEAGVYRVEVGNVAQLSQLISSASANPAIFREKRNEAARQPQRFSWEAFRQGVASAVLELETESRDHGGEGPLN